MSELLENGGFDVEAQESFLENPAEGGEGVSELAQTTSDNARKVLMRFILLVRSTELFKLGANNATDITSSSSASDSYTSITDEILITQGLGIVAAFEISADSTHEHILSAHPASDEYEIELQQRENIAEIVKNKNLPKLLSFGGVRGVAEALNTDLENGISSPREICQCKPIQLSQFLLIFVHSFLGACNNYTIFLLSCAALLSLVFGIKEEGLHMGWFNGGVLILTILIIVIATTIHKCWEERSHRMVNNSWWSKGRKLQVRVVRGGDFLFVHETDLEVGDVAFLQKGDQVPADGLFVTGQALELDDGLIKSTTIDENNPFLFYGSRVINGNARMMVTSTRMVTVWGEMMSQAMETSAENDCKFESYLHKLSTCVQIVGLLISILIIIVLFLRYKLGKLDEDRRSKPDPKGEPTPVRTIVNAIKGIITGSKGTARVLTTLLSVSLLGILEGIPFAISIAAIIWSSKTLARKATERDYLAFVKMARVTTIVTDKFGGITEHEKEIDKFYVGGEFVSESSVVASKFLEEICDGIGAQFLNGCESELPAPLISWAEKKLGMKREAVIDQCKLIDQKGHNPLQETCQVVIEKNGNGGYLHCRGPSEDLLSMCSHLYGIDGRIREIDGGKKRKLEKAIRNMQSEEAEVIAYACKHIQNLDEVSALDEPNDLIFLAMISMKETKLEDTREAVSTLMEGGIRTVLASGDDVSVLEPIGQKYGLLTHGSDDLVLTAAEFKAWAPQMRMDNVEKIRILGNCELPSDTMLLIKCLREKNQVVALLGQRTIDAPALKVADIGVTIGTWSSEVARECCHISIWDGNCFSLLVNVVNNGRCFQENIRKFIQLQLILAISSSLINFVAIVFSGDAPITAVQLFWLNLVVGLIGGLALLAGPSATTRTTMQPPVESSAKVVLISKAMWRNIAIQVSYQTAMFMVLQEKGQAILGTSRDRVKSIIYNGFYFCQMFNKFIAREPENTNIFGGLFHNMNCWFWVALVLLIICQVIFAVAEEFLGSSPGLSLKLWGACFLIGLISWPLDWAGKIASNFIAADHVEIELDTVNN